MTEATVAAPPATLDHSPDPPASDAVTTTRVLHVINGEHYSGAERVQDLLAEYLPAEGYQVGFASLKSGLFSASRRCQEAPLHATPMRSKWDRRVARQLAQLATAHGYELLHAHTPRSLLVASRVADATGLPLVYHVHSPAGRDSTRRLANLVNAWVERRAARRAAQLIAVAPGVRQYMLERGWAPDRVVYVPNGTPTSDARPRAVVPSTWNLGMFALFRPRKGVEILLEALALLRGRGYDVRLRAVGPFETPGYEGEIRQLATRLRVNDAITWTGFVDDVTREFAKVDLSVLPSLFGEGLPMVVLESMAAGAPVIASEVAGPPTAIGHGREGLLVRPGDAGALAGALAEVIDGTHDYIAMSRAAQHRHRQEFSAEAMAAGVARVYASVLKARD